MSLHQQQESTPLAEIIENMVDVCLRKRNLSHPSLGYLFLLEQRGNRTADTEFSRAQEREQAIGSFSSRTQRG